MHLVIESAVVAAVLREQFWIEQGVVEGRVEDAALILGSAFDRCSREFLIPRLPKLGPHTSKFHDGTSSRRFLRACSILIKDVPTFASTTWFFEVSNVNVAACVRACAVPIAAVDVRA